MLAFHPCLFIYSLICICLRGKLPPSLVETLSWVTWCGGQREEPSAHSPIFFLCSEGDIAGGNKADGMPCTMDNMARDSWGAERAWWGVDLHVREHQHKGSRYFSTNDFTHRVLDL